MEMSTKFRYGTRALAELGKAYPSPPLSAREIADRQSLPVKYLEHILAALKSAGIVRSIRGKQGGYVLAKKPKEIKLEEVYHVLEGSSAPVECVDHPENCSLKDFCPTRDLWIEIKQAINEVLDNSTVADLAEKSREKTAAKKMMYHI
jgi:Rrf2 family protein